MKAKEYLQQAYRLNELIDANIKELDALWNKFISIPAVDLSKERVASSPITFDKIGNAISKLDDLRDKINAEIDQYCDLKMEIHTKITQLSDKDERLILLYRYINFYTWDDIAAEMNFTVQWCHVIHRKALENFEKILNS